MTEFIAIPQKKRLILEPLFSKHLRVRTCINAVLQGYCGKAYADKMNEPNVAMLTIGPVPSGTLLTFIGGDPKHDAVKVLLDNLPNDNLIWFDDLHWLEILKALPDRDILPFKRYSFSSDMLDREHLQKMKSHIPEGFSVQCIDLNIATRINAELDAEPITVEFDSPMAFLERGIGYCAMIDDKIVCGATSGSMCDGHIEIQVDTLEPYRQKGLASAVCATLVLDCLDRNIIPHWDADNEISVKLAEKLGFDLIEEYDVAYLKPAIF